MADTIHRAKYALAEPGRLIHNAAVQITASGRISSVGTWKDPPINSKAAVVDWGSSVLLPGFINAHTHLELTSLCDRLTRFTSFTDWISQLIHQRRTWTQDQFMASTRKGAMLSLASGTTLAGDITSSGVGWSAAADINLRRVVFEEVLALSPESSKEIVAQLDHIIAKAGRKPLQVHAVSPHAPYSASSELYRQVSEYATAREMLLATHVAETAAEIEFLRNGKGEFRDFLDRMGVLPDGWKPPRLGPIQYLDSAGILGRSSLLIHCNYLDEDAIGRLKKTGTHVVYCPRSHAFFGHEAHPIRRLLDSGINVALGTDSLASNHSLSILEEMRFLFGKRKDLTPEEILRAATSSGARALHFDSVLGRLRRDYWADMAVLEWPHGLSNSGILGKILEGAGECIATIVQGKIAWTRPGIGRNPAPDSVSSGGMSKSQPFVAGEKADSKS
jgi:cytosine/adenosine deaminase-related metal-dependent hydrolase